MGDVSETSKFVQDNHAATAAVTKLDGTIVHGSRIRARHSKYWSHTWQTAVNDKVR